MQQKDAGGGKRTFVISLHEDLWSGTNRVTFGITLDVPLHHF